MLAAVVAALAASAEPAPAQSLFQTLFGFGTEQRQAPRAVPPPTYSRPPVAPRSWRSQHGERAQDAPRQSSGGRGSLRAVCVRTCDGYYWPIEDGATYGMLRDASRRCKSSCETEARLYYHDKGSSDAAAMLDLSGRRYDTLDTAFLYRKQLIEGCTCKPAPWSGAAQLRHAEYREAALRAKAELAAREAAAQRLDTARATSPPPPSPSPSRAQIAGVGAAEAVAAAPEMVAPGIVMPPPADAPQPAVETTSEPGQPRAEPPASVDTPAVRRARPVARPLGGPRRPQVRVARGARPRAHGTNTAAIGLLGLGQQKYVWPGDAR